MAVGGPGNAIDDRLYKELERRRFGFASPAELAKILDVHPKSVTRAVRRLRAAGRLKERVPRRAVLLQQIADELAARGAGYHSIASLAQAIGRSKRKTQRALIALAAAGIITRQRDRRGRCAAYVSLSLLTSQASICADWKKGVAVSCYPGRRPFGSRPVWIRSHERVRRNRGGQRLFLRRNALPMAASTTPHTPRSPVTWPLRAIVTGEQFCVRSHPHRGCGQHWPGDPQWSPGARRAGHPSRGQRPPSPQDRTRGAESAGRVRVADPTRRYTFANRQARLQLADCSGFTPEQRGRNVARLAQLAAAPQRKASPCST